MRKIHMRALEPTDIESMYRWENDETLWTTSNAHAPFSKHILTQYIIESQHNDLQTVKELRLVIEDNGQTVGCIDLCNIDVFNHRAEIGILIDNDFRRKGYATAAILGLCEYCKQHLQMHQLCAEILTENKASLRLFEKCGFEYTGTKKDWFLENGTYKDVAIYQKAL
ncbi:MAG: GNAT family N-acetyltransferase [Bacteroidales bacterium]|nr:GNAT family N-acetyltransferase [Bacteroidales bacterium]